MSTENPVRNFAYRMVVEGMRRDGLVPDLAVQPLSLAMCVNCGEEISYQWSEKRQGWKGWWEEGHDQPRYAHSPNCPKSEA